MSRLHFHPLRYSVTVICYIGVMACTVHAGSEHRYTRTLEQGIDALDNGRYDSAIVYFVSAYSKGLPRDSLFYFWAEALLRKGILDSALAANYMASTTASNTFGIKALIQRSSIYRRLGWNREAELVRDTIHASREYRRARLIPDIDMGTTIGYGAIKHATDTSTPWGIGFGSSFYEKERGPFGRADLRTTWSLVKGRRQIHAGCAGFIMHRQYNPDGAVYVSDSTDITGSVFTSVTGISWSSTYSLALQRRLDDSLFIGASTEGGFAGSGKWHHLLWGGGSVSLNTEGEWSNSRLWLFASAQKSIGKRVQLDGNVFVNGYIECPSKFGFSSAAAGVLYVEDGSWQYPVFYTDDSYTDIIDSSRIRAVTGLLRNDILASSHDTILDVSLKQPFSSISFSPRCAITLKSRFPVQLGVSWKVHWFPEPYEWDQITAYARYILYSHTDELVYIIPEDLLTNTLTITRDNNRDLAIAPAAQQCTPVIHHSQRRIDNIFSGDISVQFYKGHFGTGRIRIFGTKTWSTLSRKAPVEIPQWSASASLEWRVTITNTVLRY